MCCIASLFVRAQSFSPFRSKMTTCQKNLLHRFATLSEPNKLFAPSKATAQGNEAFNRPGFATSDSPSSDPTPAPAFLLSIEKKFKQFIQTYMETVWN